MTLRPKTIFVRSTLIGCMAALKNKLVGENPSEGEDSWEVRFIFSGELGAHVDGYFTIGENGSRYDFERGAEEKVLRHKMKPAILIGPASSWHGTSFTRDQGDQPYLFFLTDLFSRASDYSASPKE